MIDQATSINIKYKKCDVIKVTSSKTWREGNTRRWRELLLSSYYIIQINCFFWHLFEIFDARAKIFALTNLASVKNLYARCQKSFSNSLTNY